MPLSGEPALASTQILSEANLKATKCGGFFRVYGPVNFYYQDHKLFLFFPGKGLRCDHVPASQGSIENSIGRKFGDVAICVI